MKTKASNIATHEVIISTRLSSFEDQNVVGRIWQKDYTLWANAPDEISNRLGWLDCPQNMPGQVEQINAFVESVRSDGYDTAVLLGMGGSSLAPEVFASVFGIAPGFLKMLVLDSTDPGAVKAVEDKLNLERTLFIVATKSGGTVETFSFFKYFYGRVEKKVGGANASKHFIAITDPGSGLESVARKLNFRHCFLNDPNIGGRYSALSHFGLVPAALAGIDLRRLLKQTTPMVEKCRDTSDNPGIELGVIMGELANQNIDKLTLLTSPGLLSVGAWIEQLIAESSGKLGVGILPIDGESFEEIGTFANDRLFVCTKLAGDASLDSTIGKIKDAGHPVIELEMQQTYDLGAELFRWEMATAVACKCIGVNPFDQPDVESSKQLTRNTIAEFSKSGKLSFPRPAFETENIKVIGGVDVSSLEEALEIFLAQARVGGNGRRSYVAIQAFVVPSDTNARTLFELRDKLRNKLRLAVTVGFGPRFLHSTGQLHKGDGGHGLFIQITGNDPSDLDIPDEAGSPNTLLSFSTLKTSQALGDREALVRAKRKILAFHISGDITRGIAAISGNI